ncbi:hypothetical protein SAMN02745753_01849 [Marinomonas polaris DSM 16579]|uniref:Uncharacterized protein n=2 Tax=Marinomonas TaxID=28253 RepID=A0A1M5B716_9GAMM|nr:hypothetical protein SAMN02745753_01849 [Marinomonas polaris DSM 16579]
MYTKNSTDKELIEGAIKKSSVAYTILTSRYKPKVSFIFNKSFKPIEKSLSYSVEQLFEDFESNVWIDLLVKPLESLNFDENDSIGGLIDTIAKERAHSMYTRTENHRSKDSTEMRKQKLLEPEEKKKKALEKKKTLENERDQKEKNGFNTEVIALNVEIEGINTEIKDLNFEIESLKKFDFGFFEFEESEIDGVNASDPERSFIANDLKLKFFNRLSPEQQILVELRAKGETQKEIVKKTGLTLDQVRERLKKIDMIANEIKNS